MKSVFALLVGTSALVAMTAAAPQNPPPAAAGTDLYHVMFTKAAPGQAAELAKVLVVPDKANTMPEHFVVLRHQEGDDWDYAVIQHLGPKAEVVAAAAPQTAARPLTAWHSDTFVSGPSWGEFGRQMAIGASGGTGSPVYVLGVHRAVAGHREQLLTALNAPATGSSKIETGNLLLQHVEGGDWNFLTVTRYNSWQDLGTERASLAAAGAATPGGWADIRQHSAFHRDTITDRMYPVK